MHALFYYVYSFKANRHNPFTWFTINIIYFKLKSTCLMNIYSELQMKESN